MNKYLLFLPLLLSSCATIQEAEEQQPIKSMARIPAITNQLDSAQMSKIKSAIQSSSNTILSNNLVYHSGEWSLSLSESEADSLGVSKDLYSSYVKTVNGLNQSHMKHE